MKRNTAGQIIGAQMVAAADGSAFSGSVTVYVTGDGGTQAAGSVGSGACTHEGNGFHSYAPAQAETAYDHIAFTFIGSGAVPATVQVYPSHPQTGDAYARLGAPAGASVSADVAAIKSDSAAILIDTAEIGAAGAGLTALATAANLATVAGYLDTEIAAILADTNELQTDWANGGRLDLILDARASQTSVDDLPTNAELATALGTADDATLAAIAGLSIPSAAAIADAVWDEATSGHVSAGSTGLALGNTDLRGSRTVIRGTASTGGSTTSLTPSALSPSGTDADQFKGRILVFDNDTTTAALRGQATDITASSAASLAVLTFTALTTAPASGDTFSIV